MIQSVRWKQLILTTFNQIPVRIHFSSMTRDSILLSLSLFYFFSISKGSGKSMMDLQTEIKSRRDRKRGKKSYAWKSICYIILHTFSVCINLKYSSFIQMAFFQIKFIFHLHVCKFWKTALNTSSMLHCCQMATSFR